VRLVSPANFVYLDEPGRGTVAGQKCVQRIVNKEVVGSLSTELHLHSKQRALLLVLQDFELATSARDAPGYQWGPTILQIVPLPRRCCEG
jgi:hypothetical protein